MNNKKQFALNTLFIGVLIAFVILTQLSILVFKNNKFSWKIGLGFGLAALLIALFSAAFAPYGYVFDKDGISIRYVFLPEERYLLKNIRTINIDSHITHSSSDFASFFDLIFGSAYHITGEPEGRRRFYMTGHIRKSVRTKRLLKKYWHKELK